MEAVKVRSKRRRKRKGADDPAGEIRVEKLKNKGSGSGTREPTAGRRGGDVMSPVAESQGT